MNWWIADYYNAFGPAFVVSWVVWMILSVVMHELSHGWAAIWCGDDTPRALGHMTPNPIVHMGWMSLAMFALVGITWGAMPINPSRFRGRHDDALVALAGPAMNVLLAAASLLLLVGWSISGGFGMADPWQTNVRQFLFLGSMLNIVLALFNLIPVPPLDGSKVMASYFQPYREFFSQEKGAVVAVILFTLVFMRSGGLLFDAAGTTVARSERVLVRLIRPASVVP